MYFPIKSWGALRLGVSDFQIKDRESTQSENPITDSLYGTKEVSTRSGTHPKRKGLKYFFMEPLRTIQERQGQRE
jgi:hypothetical protein